MERKDTPGMATTATRIPGFTIERGSVMERQFAVWYASAGCLPDGDGPEFVGSFRECELYVSEQRDEQRTGGLVARHDLYQFSIEEWEEDSDETS